MSAGGDNPVGVIVDVDQVTPQSMAMGKLLARIKLTTVRKFSGQELRDPKDVADQSIERISSPAPPPPERNSSSWFRSVEEGR
jgi:hypothetical protein